MGDIKDPPFLLPTQGHTGCIFSIVFSSDGLKLAAGSDDNTARVWDMTTGEQSKQPMVLEVRVMGREVAPPNHRLNVPGVALAQGRGNGVSLVDHSPTVGPLWPVDGGSRTPPFLSPLRVTPGGSRASPSAPMGGSWPLAARKIWRGCGICPLARSPWCSRSVRAGRGSVHPQTNVRAHTGGEHKCRGQWRGWPQR